MNLNPNKIDNINQITNYYHFVKNKTNYYHLLLKRIL